MILSISALRSRDASSGKNKKLYLSSHPTVLFFTFFPIVIRSQPYWVFFSFSRNTQAHDVTYPSFHSRPVRIRSIISDLSIGDPRRSSMSEFFSFEESSIVFASFDTIATFPRNARILSLGGLSLNAWQVATTSSIFISVLSDHTPDPLRIQVTLDRSFRSQFARSHSYIHACVLQRIKDRKRKLNIRSCSLF